ncbi:MAG: GAF domain-containing protein [Bacteroidales bacterium]|nr:GAF domain-containing protein [Bacteroidales bacterium]MBN2819254.1 GAF domain-containing protein [Bacteroidales bacterium]
MSFKNLKIAFKIILGFGVIVLAVIVFAFTISNSLSKSRAINKEVNQIYAPSVELIRSLYSQISDSRMLIKSWVHIDKIADTPDKIKLKGLHDTEYQSVMDSLLYLSTFWSDDTSKAMLQAINTTIVDTLFPKHKYIMGQLNTFVSYEDPFIVFEVTPMVEENGEIMEITRVTLERITGLLTEQEYIIASKREESDDSFGRLKNFVFIMLLGQILFAAIIATFVIFSLSKPINATKNMLLSISKGILPEDKLREGDDEIGQMAKALHAVVISLRDVSKFAIEIGKGNFSTEFKPLSDEDVLGYSLIEMKNELHKAKQEEEIRAEENRQRTWSSQGVALFSDILRKNDENINDLTFDIISNMVQYTNSNQGGIFILNDNDPDNLFLEMTACYAFDRQKFIKRKIEIGEGLVGRCYQEQEKIFLTDIPADYIKISSGLGEDSPKCLLLVPLAYNDNIFGIMEIASFNVYQEFEIEFMERIGETIAATISSVKANIQTQTLLEQSQQQAEEMSAQEEEMRQNMEELRATQEQSARREQELMREVETLRKQLEKA